MPLPHLASVDSFASFSPETIAGGVGTVAHTMDREGQPADVTNATQT